MTFSKLIIIGSGKWPLKIQTVLNQSNSSLQIDVISARKFLESPKFAPSHISTDSIIWIATRPDIQLKILEKLKQVDKKIIIEKPVVVNMSQLETLKLLLAETKNDIFPSEPWKYSEIWAETRRILNNNSQSVKIRIERGGPERREYISQIWDWIPHDLGLVTDLIKDLKGEVKLHVESQIGDDQIFLRIDIPNHFTFEICSGYFESRTAFWETESGLYIDFINHSIMQDEIKIADFRNDQPLVNMYNKIIEARDTPNVDISLTELLLKADQKIN